MEILKTRLKITEVRMGWFYNGKCTSKARLDGKTAVVTGCNTGARVIMACRNLEKAEEAANDIRKTLEGVENVGELSIKHLDLSSLSSVRKCAEQLLKEETNIHLLINNAGVMMCPRQLTEDGYEMQFATNHLGHFLLTLILLPRILNSAPARIVNVSSIAHKFGSLHSKDINLEKSYQPVIAYGRSKLCNILFTKELAKRLEGTGVTVYSLHPGVVDTDLDRHLDSAFFPGSRWFYRTFGNMFKKSSEQGAQTTLYCAVDESTANQTGLYYDDCVAVRPTGKANDPEQARKLWDISIEMVHWDKNRDPFQKG
ncbi:retinol dehydrogenase 12 isoform X2 [Nilaparvata lugens]|uniref:retinol dehydrogenase 12 isoform X2 n=2 Tax=Nilaparvata lugens TaxID=108931 RepID=UPI00193D5EFE|nr:retinol dehydrogenase 12 isoform X2 [Nilaparvata lugens]